MRCHVSRVRVAVEHSTRSGATFVRRQVRGHQLAGAPAARGERAVVVGERRVVPAGLRVAQQMQLPDDRRALVASPRLLGRQETSAGIVSCRTSISCHQPLDGVGLDEPGAEPVHRLRTARDAEAQAFAGRLVLVARGDVAGEERVARTDRRDRLAAAGSARGTASSRRGRA